MASLKDKWGERVPFWLLLLAWVMFHYGVLFQGQTFVLEDSSRFFYPLWKWGAGAWNRGIIPLWNPDAAFGTPYLADPQMAAWYPPVRLFYFLLSPTLAFTFVILFHHLWALMGFWVYARGRGYSPWIALGGALLFGFSFNAITLSWATPMLFAYSWIPWVFHSVDSLRKKQSTAFLFLSISIAMQMAAGYPLFSYLTLLVMVLDWFLVNFLSGLGKNWKSEAGMEMGAVLMAFVFNAAWLLPFKEFMPCSNLGERLGLSESLGWSDLLTWLNPFSKGHPLHSHPETPFSVSVYFAGLPSLVVVGWLFLNRKASRSSMALFLILLLLSLGSTGLVGGWLGKFVPAYGLIVRSGYWIPFVVWALARLFLEADGHLALMTGKNIKWVALILLIYGLALVSGVPWVLISFWLSFLFLLLAGLPRFFNWSWRSLFLAISLALSLGPVDRSIAFTMGWTYYDRPPEVFSQIVSPGRIYNAPSVEELFRNVSGNGVADIYSKLKEAAISNWPLAFGLQEVGYNNALFLKSFLNWYYAPAQGGNGAKILNYLSCSYVEGGISGFNDSELRRSETAPFFNNPSVEPNWRSCRKTVLEKDWRTDFDEMKEKKFQFSDTCFVSNTMLIGDFRKRLVSEIPKGPNEKVLEAIGEGRAFLVSNETSYPGWKILGSPADGVGEVNHGFQGVEFADGVQQATVSFRPTTFRLGAFLSLLACVCWSGMILKKVFNFHA